jgi:uncharacterized repeat protein (TIGR03803 family)
MSKIKIMSFMKLTRIFLAFLMGLAAIPAGRAQTYTVLYSFTGGADGASPKGGLILDADGNVYGTTQGINFYPYPYPQTTGTTAGSVFRVSSSGQFTLLYNFAAGGANGAGPSGGLVRDSAGNLYGATSGGGASVDPNCFAGGGALPLQGCGEVFKVDAAGNFSVLFSFSGKSDCWTGCWPLAPLTLDAAGNLYGTSYLGGSRDCNASKLNRQGYFLNSDCGVVFKLDPSGKETVLHRFGKARRDGDFPNPGLTLDAAGNLYGATFGGGINSNGGNAGAGTVFKLDPSGNETVLFYFQEFVNGYYPNGGLFLDGGGNLYGTTQGSVGIGQNGVFKLDPEGNLTDLASGGVLGGTPLAGLIVDAAGNFFGTTLDGGNLAPNCGYFGNGQCGRIFRLDPSGNLTFVYQFTGFADGASPYAGLVMDAVGNLYGTTAYGGTVNSNCPAGCGVVFKITP